MEPTYAGRTLYKRDSKGKIRVWSVDRTGDSYSVKDGIQDGKIKASSPTVCVPKNVGRANETSPVEQAIFEVDALYTKKLKTGYFDRIENVDSGTALFPMLAFKYRDLKKPLPFGEEDIFGQRKLDGIRNLARPTGNFSRKAEKNITFPQVSDALRPAFEEYPNLSVDGELYSHQFADDLPKINSIVRKKTPTPEQILQAGVLQFHMYDLFDADQPDMPFGERIEMLEAIYVDYLIGHPSFALVETILLRDQEHMDGLYADWRLEGYEGQIIRRDAPYEPAKRPQVLLKRKEYVDKEFRVTGISPGTGNWANAAKSIEYVTDDGKPFSTGMTGSYEDNVQVLLEAKKYIGGEGTVAFFKYSPKGVPVQGVTKALYDGGRDV